MAETGSPCWGYLTHFDLCSPRSGLALINSSSRTESQHSSTREHFRCDDVRAAVAQVWTLLACATSSSLTSRQTNAAEWAGSSLRPHKLCLPAAQLVGGSTFNNGTTPGRSRACRTAMCLISGNIGCASGDPHVHHWDSMMVVENTTGSLFPSDLFIQPDDQPPVVREDRGQICAGGTGQLAYLAAPIQYCASSIVSSGLHQAGYTRCTGAACVARRCRDTWRH